VTILSIVPEGTYITQEDVDNGKVLVQLDSSAFEEDLTQREIDLASAESSFLQAKESLDIQKKQNESDIAAAELKVRFALVDLRKELGADIADKLVADLNDVNDTGRVSEYIASILQDVNSVGGAAGQKLNQLRDDIILAEQTLKRDQDTYIGTQKLHDANYVSDLELERDRLQVIGSQFRLKRAREALRLYKLYDFPKSVEKLLSDYHEAKRQLDRTYAQARSKLAQAQANLKSAESRYRSRIERLERTKRQIANCTIRAPAPGLVIYGSSDNEMRRFRGTGIIAEGETVYQYQTIISLPDTSEMIAEVDVHESSVDRVRPGQKARIVIEAFPDETFTGEVIKVAPLPNQDRRWFNPDTKVYTTQVSIDGSHDFLKPGMSAKVEILVEQLKDVLVVPIQSVATRRGRKVCYRLVNGQVEEREVKTGSFNEYFVQILDGLAEGDQVLLTPPPITEEGGTEQSQASVTEQWGQPEQQGRPQSARQGQPDSRRDQTMRKPGNAEDFELTDEIADKALMFIEQSDPEKAAQLKQLRETDPEKFKAELRNLIREQFKKTRQGIGALGSRDRGDGGEGSRRGRSGRRGSDAAAQ